MEVISFPRQLRPQLRFPTPSFMVLLKATTRSDGTVLQPENTQPHDKLTALSLLAYINRQFADSA